MDKYNEGRHDAGKLQIRSIMLMKFIMLLLFVTFISVSEKVCAYEAGTNESKKPSVESCHLSKDSVRIKIGHSKKLKGVFSPEGSYEKLIWKSKNEKVATVDENGRITAVAAGDTVIKAYSIQLHAKFKCKVTVYSGKQVAITFDDGPGSYTAELLDFLKEKDVKATFFLIGQSVSNHSDLVKRMKDEGHEIGGHSYTHAQLTKCSKSKIKSEMKKTNKAIKEACGSNPTLFRPPYGSYNSTVLERLKVPAITWSVDTLDWKYRDAAYVEKTIVNSAYEGAIILLHDIHSTTVQGAKKAIERLKKKGYEFLTVTELLSRDGEIPEAGKVYNSAKKPK